MCEYVRLNFFVNTHKCMEIKQKSISIDLLTFLPKNSKKLHYYPFVSGYLS